MTEHEHCHCQSTSHTNWCQGSKAMWGPGCRVVNKNHVNKSRLVETSLSLQDRKKKTTCSRPDLIRHLRLHCQSFWRNGCPPQTGRCSPSNALPVLSKDRAWRWAHEPDIGGPYTQRNLGCPENGEISNRTMHGRQSTGENTVTRLDRLNLLKEETQGLNSTSNALPKNYTDRHIWDVCGMN